jgi:HlyD family secretion protein
MPSLRLILFSALGAAILGALAIVAFRTEPEPVDLHAVARGTLVGIVRADGTARVRDVYEIAAPVAGIADRIALRLGDPVKAGQTVLAVVEPSDAPILDARSRAQAEATLTEARAALSAAEAELLAAREELAYAEGQHDRAVQLMDRGLTTLVVMEEAVRALHAAETGAEAAASRRAMAEGAADRAEAALDDPVSGGACCRAILSPIDGVVLRVDAVSRRPVAAGTPLLAVGDPTDLEIAADLLSADAVRLPEGAPARVLRWGGDPLEARLRRIDPVARTDVSALGIEEQRVDAIFDLLAPPEARPGLAHGYGLVLEIETWRADDALILPLPAAFRDDDGWAVFVEMDGAAQLRPVALGRLGETAAEVLDGLAEGERVVLHPNDSIADGIAVDARD